MNPIGAIRPLSIAELGLPQAAAMDRAAGPGPIAPEQLDRLAAAVESPASGGSASGAGSFSALLGQMVQDVQARNAAANQAMTGVLAGEGVPLHEAVLASEEASVSFQLMVEVRNRLLESYQELMRMQV
jgi:flagellar hook-basal body complex protein FliE